MSAINNKVLVSVTTITGVLWQRKIQEVKKFGLKELALFVTCLDREHRKYCYSQLETLGNIEIPFVHARSDMHPEEYRYLMDRFGTRLFNLHTASQRAYSYDISDLREHICIENSGPIKASDFDGYNGICLDLSHFEEDSLFAQHNCETVKAAMKSHVVRANHISAVLSRPRPSKRDPSQMRVAFHQMEDVSQLDYVGKYPSTFFGKYIAIELENSIEDQLVAKKHLEITLQAGFAE